jgi:hypothetical protein
MPPKAMASSFLLCFGIGVDGEEEVAAIRDAFLPRGACFSPSSGVDVEIPRLPDPASPEIGES